MNLTQNWSILGMTRPRNMEQYHLKPMLNLALLLLFLKGNNLLDTEEDIIYRRYV
jgi:hypothetical protein